jgi:hypothetical protein
MGAMRSRVPGGNGIALGDAEAGKERGEAAAALIREFGPRAGVRGGWSVGETIVIGDTPRAVADPAGSGNCMNGLPG